MVDPSLVVEGTYQLVLESYDAQSIAQTTLYTDQISVQISLQTSV